MASFTLSVFVEIQLWNRAVLAMSALESHHSETTRIASVACKLIVFRLSNSLSWLGYVSLWRPDIARIVILEWEPVLKLHFLPFQLLMLMSFESILFSLSGWVGESDMFARLR
eukprot:GHVN01051396.1.p1 GENE.GHVN01051396.1~~GHVN01051396.1.p1  ORF type:complete len:113 (-),score=5.75 GHVN01051396.1:111-449(-)